MHLYTVSSAIFLGVGLGRIFESDLLIYLTAVFVPYALYKIFRGQNSKLSIAAVLIMIGCYGFWLYDTIAK